MESWNLLKRHVLQMHTWKGIYGTFTTEVLDLGKSKFHYLLIDFISFSLFRIELIALVSFEIIRVNFAIVINCCAGMLGPENLFLALFPLQSDRFLFSLTQTANPSTSSYLVIYA